MSYLDGGVPQAPLDQAHVGAMKTSPVRQGFLREPLGDTLAPNSAGKGGGDAFAAHGWAGKLLTAGLLLDRL